MSNLLKKAIEHATFAHRNQYRKDGKTPYFEHPRRVAELLKKEGASDYVIAAGFLHDVLEDTDMDIDDFPQKVKNLVQLMTKQKGSTKLDGIKQVAKDKDALLIKMADRLDNYLDTGTAHASEYLSRPSVQESTVFLLNEAKERGLNDTSIYKRLKTITDNFNL